MSDCEDTILGGFSILKRIEDLPPELIDLIIEFSIFSEPKGSHQALHTIMKLHQVELGTIFNSRVENVFKSHSFQKQIIANWRMFPDFARGKASQHTVDKNAEYDLASRSLNDCSQCFQFLLQRHAITASCFCQTGESLYWIAWKNQNLKQGACLLASLSYEHLLQPFLIDRLGAHGKTIFQSSTWSEPWFKICWDLVKSQPHGALSSLGPHEIGQICRFADPRLSQELLGQGLELGRVHTGFSSPWMQVLAQKKPESMFVWLWENGYRPLEGFLEDAARYFCTEAAGWIMCHTNYQDWCRALLIAAGSTEARSGEFFEVLVKQEIFTFQRGENFACDILIRVVDEVCMTSDQYHRLNHEGRHPHWKDHPSDFDQTISNLQKIAVR